MLEMFCVRVALTEGDNELQGLCRIIYMIYIIDIKLSVVFRERVKLRKFCPLVRISS